MRGQGRPPWRFTAGAALTALAALAACAAPPPPLAPGGLPVAEGSAPLAIGAEAPGGAAASARAREEQKRGIGIPPALPPPGVVDRLPGASRASRPAPGTGPSPAPPRTALPVPGNALSRMSALPASPLANPPAFSSGRPW